MYYSQDGKHRVDHYQRLHTPSKLLHRRTQSISGSSDDDDGTLILGDLNAHHSSWYSSSTDSRGTMLESTVSGSNFGILNRDSPTRLPGNANPSSLVVSLASASLITSTNWQTKTNLGSVTINPIQHHSSINLKKANWDRYSREIEDKLSKRRFRTNQKGEKILRAITTHTLWTTPT